MFDAYRLSSRSLPSCHESRNLSLFCFCLSVHRDAFTSPPTLPVISLKLNLLPHLHLLTFSSPKILVERTIRLVTLFFDRAAEFEQLVRNRLVGGFKNVNQGAREGFIVLGEEGDGDSGGAGTTSSNV